MGGCGILSNLVCKTTSGSQLDISFILVLFYGIPGHTWNDWISIKVGQNAILQAACSAGGAQDPWEQMHAMNEKQTTWG